MSDLTDPKEFIEPPNEADLADINMARGIDAGIESAPVPENVKEYMRGAQTFTEGGPTGQPIGFGLRDGSDADSTSQGSPDGSYDFGWPVRPFERVSYHDKQTEARLEGYSWPEINDHLDGRMSAAMAEGYTETEVRSYLKLPEPRVLQDRLGASWAISLADDPMSFVEPPPGPMSITPLESMGAGRIAGYAGQTAPEPTMPEPGVTDLASSFNLHDAQMRRTYADALLSGEVKTPSDFAERYTGAFWGALANQGVEIDGSMSASLVRAGRSLADTLPSNEELTDVAIAIAHKAGRQLDREIVGTVKQNLIDAWKETGVSPLSLYDATGNVDLLSWLTELKVAGTLERSGEVILNTAQAFIEGNKGIWYSEENRLTKATRELHEIMSPSPIGGPVAAGLRIGANAATATTKAVLGVLAGVIAGGAHLAEEMTQSRPELRDTPYRSGQAGMEAVEPIMAIMAFMGLSGGLSGLRGTPQGRLGDPTSFLGSRPIESLRAVPEDFTNRAASAAVEKTFTDAQAILDRAATPAEAVRVEPHESIAGEMATNAKLRRSYNALSPDEQARVNAIEVEKGTVVGGAWGRLADEQEAIFDRGTAKFEKALSEAVGAPVFDPILDAPVKVVDPLKPVGEAVREAPAHEAYPAEFIEPDASRSTEPLSITEATDFLNTGKVAYEREIAAIVKEEGELPPGDPRYKVLVERQREVEGRLESLNTVLEQLDDDQIVGIARDMGLRSKNDPSPIPFITERGLIEAEVRDLALTPPTERPAAAAAKVSFGPVEIRETAAGGTFEHWPIVGEGGAVIGDVQISRVGNVAHIDRMGVGEGVTGKAMGEPNAVGPRAMRQLAREYFEKNPEIETIEGFRMTGARGISGGRDVSITREQIMGRRGEPPPAEVAPAEVIARAEGHDAASAILAHFHNLMIDTAGGGTIEAFFRTAKQKMAAAEYRAGLDFSQATIRQFRGQADRFIASNAAKLDDYRAAVNKHVPDYERLMGEVKAHGPGVPGSPAPAPGMVRFYHGAKANPAVKGEPRWVSDRLAYATGYADGGTVHYTDIPVDHPILRNKKSFDDTGTSMKSPYVHFEVPAELADWNLHKVGSPGGSHLLDGNPLHEMLKYIEGRSLGATMDRASPLFQVAEMLRTVNENMRAQIHAAIPDMRAFREDYYRHLWKSPDAGALDRVFGIGVQGSGRSLQRRSIPTIAEGIEAGLIPNILNPIDNTMHYIAGMSYHLAAKKILKSAEGSGYIKFTDVPSDWVELNGMGATRVFATPASVALRTAEVRAREALAAAIGTPGEAAARTVFQEAAEAARPTAGMQRASAPLGFATSYNYWVGKGFYGMPNAAPWYTKMQYFANAMTGMLLALPGYHFTAIVQETAVNGLATALGAIGRGQIAAGLKGVGMSVTVAPEAVRQTLRGGWNSESGIYKRWLDLNDNSEAMTLFTDAGGRMGPRQDIYRFGEARSMFKSLAEGSLKQEVVRDFKDVIGTAEEAPGQRLALLGPRLVGLAGKEIGRMLNTMTDPMFDHMIPAVKNAVTFDALESWLKANPTAPLEAKRAMARRIINSTDDRLGEMNQANLFWPTAIKQSLNLVTVSLGWEYGSLRAAGIAGNKADQARLQGRLTMDRLRWLVALPMVDAIMGSAYQYLKTGTLPESFLQAQFPGIGGGQHATLPGYLGKDFAQWAKIGMSFSREGVIEGLHATGDWIGHHGNPLKASLWDFITGEDAIGHKIRGQPQQALHYPFNTNGIYFHLPKEWAQYMSNLWGHMLPIFIQGMSNAKAGSNLNWMDRAFGFREAPTWVEDIRNGTDKFWGGREKGYLRDQQDEARRYNKENKASANPGPAAPVPSSPGKGGGGGRQYQGPQQRPAFRPDRFQ